jgi:hypothetical protein
MGDDVVADRSIPFSLPVERRYPLDLSSGLPEVRRYFDDSNRDPWDPETDVDWDAPDRSRHDEATLRAAAVVWSSRGWRAFAAISESEALLVRMCIETDREADLKYGLGARATDNAAHADACRLMAEACGGYHDRPSSDDLSELLTTDVIRRALHAQVDADGFFAGHVVLLAAIDLAHWSAAIASTSDEAASRVLARCRRDKERQLEFGWAYLDARRPQLTAAARSEIERALDHTLTGQGLRTGSSAMLDPAVAGVAELHAALEATHDAGLGAATLLDEVEAVRSAVAATRSRLAGLDISLAGVHHPKYGDF